MGDKNWVIYVLRGADMKVKYVGMTGSFKTRISQHESSARKGVEYPIYKWLRKHSNESYKWEIIATCLDRESCYAAEILYIKQFGLSNLLNVEEGGPGSPRSLNASRQRNPRVVKHGTFGEYNNHKCRCEKCKEANRVQGRRARKERYQLEPDDERHGTYNGYTNYKCRCDLCVEAQRLYWVDKGIRSEGHSSAHTGNP